MKFKSSILAQASGSVGGSTYSHNKGGMYIRNRSIPTNPSSSFQQVVRNAMTTLSQRWVVTLTNAQRAAWKVYADTVLIPDTLGEPRAIPALAMYQRCNIPRIQNSVAVIDDAPTTFDIGSFTAPVITVTASTDLASVAFTNTDAWATAAGGYLIIKFSAPNNPSINFFKGPYRLAGKVTGAASPPASPASMALPFPCAVGNVIFAEANVAFSDGRYSSPLRFRIVAG